MTRFVQLGILMLALLGLVGQATAHAMARGHTPTTTMNSMQMASDTMSCNDTQPAESDKAPCKKVGLQCAAALGCASPYMIEADGPASDYVALEPLKSIVGRVNALDDRTVAPEPEPPSFLI
jgi:hypothetical protein